MTVADVAEGLVMELESVTVTDGVPEPVWETTHFTDQLVVPVQPLVGSPVHEYWYPPDPPVAVALNQTAWFTSRVVLDGCTLEIEGSVLTVSFGERAADCLPAASSTYTTT